MLSSSDLLPRATVAVTASYPLSVALLAAGAALVAAGWMRLIYGRRTRELRESEARFRALFDNAVEGVYESSPEGGFRRVNPALARIFGYASPAEMLRIKPEQMPGLYASATRRAEFLAAFGAGDEVVDFESEIQRPDGSLAWIKENVRAVRDARGRVLYLQGFVSDITARRSAEAALRASEERFRVLFEHSPIAIVEYDYRAVAAWLEELRASGVTDLAPWLDEHPEALAEASARVKIAGANPAALRLFGLNTLEQGDANLSQFYTAEAYAARRQTFIELWHGGTQTEGDFTARTGDGQIRHVGYRWTVPMIDGRPFFERTQIALVDLTRIKNAERALATEREQLDVTLRAMAEGVITTDPAGVVQFMNDAAGQLTGWAPAAAVGHALSEVCPLVAPRPSGIVTAPVAAALAAGRPVDLPPQSELRFGDGSRKRVDGRCAPMRDVAGRPVGAVFVFRDVTERARLEAELLRASKLESIGVLAGGIAHDFNNLLTIVMGNLTLALLDEQTAAVAGPWLREAERGTLRARDLTQQLLTFAKGGEPLRRAVSLADVVREAAEFGLHGASAACEFQLAPDLRPAEVDKGQIGQVVQNLVINAVQAMPQGGVIRVSLRNETLGENQVAALPSGDYLRLEICDTGCGIPNEHLAHIFEPFFTTKETGTGLGLATVYSVIQKHSGHVSVQSEVGRGTTFTVWLPAAREEPAAPPSPTAAVTPLRGRVLFMDDEEPLRVMTKTLLERLGLEATATADGNEAVREYTRSRMAGAPFDLVIMDLTVPGAMGGAAAMREILKIDPQARGVVSSGYSSDPVMANYRAHGFCGMVPKPYKVAEFARTIREVLNLE